MRTINSPGVQITEIDLSNYAQPSIGTNVFIAGFADSGPIDEVVQVQGATDLEEIYGNPKTAAEAYFQESCKQILSSPGNLYCTRLPYGSGAGEGFAEQYSALLFPAASSISNLYTATSTIQVQSIRITGEEGIESVDFNSGISVETIVKTRSNLTVGGENTTYTIEGTKTINIEGIDTQVLSISTVSISYESTPGDVIIKIGAPRQVTLTLDEYQEIVNGEFEWTEVLDSAGAEPQLNLYDTPTMDNVAFVVLNTSKSTNNEKGGGYYVSLADNTNFGPQSDYDSILGVKGLSANNSALKDAEDDSLNVDFGQVEIPASRFTVALQSAYTDAKASLSKNIETIPKFNFGDEYFSDSVVFNVHKISTSNSQPNLLNINMVEAYLGSFDHNKKTIADSGGVQRTFFLEDVVNRNSTRIKMIVNPAIARSVSWTDNQGSTSNPIVKIRIAEEAKYLFAAGVYLPLNSKTNTKDLGNVAAKLEHALRLVENTDAYTLDIVADAGLSTLHTNRDVDGSYDDLKRLPTELLSLENPESTAITSWREVYNVLETFAAETRKDCMAIVDPLRQCFLRGNSKTAERRGASFTASVYTPLKNLLAASDNNYVAAYGNWGKGMSTALDRKMWLPLSAAVAAVYCKNDAIAQPWFAPAGFTRGNLAGITDLACNPTQKQRDNLYTISINPVVFFPNEGFIVFGQKTLQHKPTAFDRVNVRRLFLTLERSTLRTLKYFVFEPNTVITRTRLLNTIGPIFAEAKRTQGVYDYMIVCDDRNNTSDSIDRNELIVDIYLKPVKAAEFILVNFIATRTGQDFSELI